MTTENRHWTEIDAMAGKLHREAEGLPELELLSTQKGAYAIRAEVDDAALIMGVEQPTRLNVRISRATPALALTIVDAVKAYARLNGLLVCPHCGHPEHGPMLCTETVEAVSICECDAGVPGFDLIEGGGQ